jgi:hypothetical protein
MGVDNCGAENSDKLFLRLFESSGHRDFHITFSLSVIPSDKERKVELKSK